MFRVLVLLPHSTRRSTGDRRIRCSLVYAQMCPVDARFPGNGIIRRLRFSIKALRNEIEASVFR